jgi:ferredoxin-NADP reductase
LLRDALPKPGVTCLVCGPPTFTEDARALLMKLGVDEARVLTEKY